MKALSLNRQTSDKIEISDKPTPELGSNEVLVKIKAAALNHRDEWCRQGLYPNIKDGVTLGSDGAGLVHSIGSDVDNNWLNQEVIINPAFNWGQNPKFQGKDFKILGNPDDGTFAEFVKVPADRLVQKPEHLSWEEAASLPLGGLTAYRALFVQGQLQAGEKILVTGFGGGVAQFAAQFALAAGAEVYVSSSSVEKISYALELGIAGGFTYTDKGWVKEAQAISGGFDCIIDSAMGDTLDNLIKVTKPGGRIVFYGATLGNPTSLDARRVFWNQIRLIGSTMGSDQDFSDMIAFVEKNSLKPIVDEVFPLEKAAEAFDRMKAGKQLGKLVLSF